MKGDSTLTKAEREAIAVVVSVTNDCAYCIAAHSAALRKLTKDPALADQIAADYGKADIPDRMKRALDYAVKLDANPVGDVRGGRPAPARRGLERRGRDGHRRGDRGLQLLQPHGLRSRLGAEPRVRDARPLMALDPARVVSRLRELQELTGDEDGAQRVAWTDTWARARSWLADSLSDLPLDVERDEAGNDWYTLRGESERAVLLGGHMDSVPERRLARRLPQRARRRPRCCGESPGRARRP